jgi:hypothetical protein
VSQFSLAPGDESELEMIPVREKVGAVIKFAYLACLLLASASTSMGVVLNWATNNWPAGSLSQSYNVDPTNPGNDITITIRQQGTFISGSCPLFHPMQRDQRDWRPCSHFLGQVTVDGNDHSTAGEKAPVKNLLIEHDASPPFQTGPEHLGTTATVNRVSVAPGGAAVSVTNTGGAFTATGVSLNQGTSTVSTISVNFGNTPVTQISFVYGQGSDAPVNPDATLFTLGNIAFSLTTWMHAH